MRRLLLSLCLVLLAACSLDLGLSEQGPPYDPRLGEQGRVRFLGPGCASSTTLAVGSHVTLALQPATGHLPTGLAVQASAPAIIDAATGQAPGTITLRAHAEGGSRIELLSGGALYDALGFRAEPAAAALYQSAARVFAGGRIDVVVSDVFGGCGTDACPLIGYGFLGWTVGPPSLATLLLDDEGTAAFRTSAVGAMVLSGREPARGTELVSHAVEIVPTTGVTALVATVTTIPLAEGEAARSFPLPGTIHVGEAFFVALAAQRAAAPPVPLSRHDVEWSTDEELVSSVPMAPTGDPLGTIFYAPGGTGEAELAAEVPLLAESASFPLTITL